MPTVSVTMPTYNGQRYIREALNALLAQDYTDFEIVVVVDGSKDNTESILNEYKDPRIRVISKKSNEGLPAAINTGLKASVGKYWCWTSDDNLHEQGALKAMVEALEENPESSIVAPYIRHFRDGGWFGPVGKIECNCFLCLRDAALKIGGYRSEYMLVEDADFFVRFIHEFGPIKRIPKPLYLFRDHAHNLSTTQIGKRQYVSVLLHYDLVSRGYENISLRGVFKDRIRIASLYHGYEWIDKIVDFAKQKNLPFVQELIKSAKYYKMPIISLYMKIEISILGRIKRMIGIKH